MERSISFKNFRNLGIGNDDKSIERIVLNHSLEKGKMGELVILIGPNNAGKSNVLDGIKKLSVGKLDSQDKTILKTDEEYLSPKIRMTVKDENKKYFKEIGINSNETRVKRIDAFEKEPKVSDSEASELKEIVAYIKSKLNLDTLKTGNGEAKRQDAQAVDEFCKNIDDKKYLKALTDFHSSACYSRYKGLNSVTFYDGVRCQSLLNVTKLIISSAAFQKLFNNDYSNEFIAQYGMPLIPNIYEYSEKMIGDSDLSSSPSNISKNEFFKSLFTQEDFKAIQTIYERIKSLNSPGLLDNLKDRFASSLENINKIFNSMYFAEKDKYEFSLIFESSNIYFKLKRGSKVIVLNQQSTGFRWFFNFYFNFINTKSLNAGDIVLMDEPATNLHPRGQEELRKFIKQLARKNDITFVIATHSPFFIDVDNYDEIRTISIEDNIAHINNLFTVMDTEDPDSLTPIKQALTVERNVLYREDIKIVFVEGITDYNYLTMFKNIFKKDSLAFLPFQGVGKGKDLQKKIISSLVKIGRRNSTVLTDSDKPAIEFKHIAKEMGTDLNIINLCDIDSSFKEIESLFSEQDIKTYKLDIKNSHLSSLMKNLCKKEDFTSQTVNNFKKLLDQLEID